MDKPFKFQKTGLIIDSINPIDVIKAIDIIDIKTIDIETMIDIVSPSNQWKS